MNNNLKLAQSSAIRAEVKRHDTVRNTINKLFKQLERVGDQQLRTGLKVFLHSLQGELPPLRAPMIKLFLTPSRLHYGRVVLITN